ncbi:MspA family porin [Gordonia sp. NPDC057258]|uniref:MspA family porin n=1 Tax=unclassified Gordonia (in: high G+C Gram-positive bacteria) TaxID=2657482 RepID=UPI00363C000E
MSKFSKLGLRRAAGAVAIASAAVVGLAGMGVGEAAAAPLANGYKVASGIDGEKVQTWRTQESQYSVKRVAYNGGLGRTAVLSGVYTSKATAEVAGSLKVYVIAGCQLDVSSLQLGGGGGLSLGGSPLMPASPTFGLNGGVSIPITLGEAAVVEVGDKDISEGGVASIQLQDFEINFPNCGGYASARSVTQTIAAKGYNIEDDGSTVEGEGTLLKSTLYGQPFFVS